MAPYVDELMTIFLPCLGSDVAFLGCYVSEIVVPGKPVIRTVQNVYKVRNT
jgi:hypothetical protein